MENLLTPQNVMFVIGIISMIFSVFFYFRSPQEAIEKKQSLDALATGKDKLIAEKDLGNKATVLAQKEMESKADLLAKQVEWEKTANEKRFADMGVRLDGAFTIAQNHINTIETEVKTLSVMINSMENKITELATIIDERIPKREVK